MRNLIARVVFALALLLLALPAQAQNEPLWARVVRPLLMRQVPGLTIEGLSGTLTRDPRAARITMADEHGIWLILEDVGLVIDRAALFRGRVRLEEISAVRGALPRLPAGAAAETQVEEAPPEAQSTLPTLPTLSFGIEVDRIAIGRFDLGEPVLGLAAALALEGRIALTDGRLNAALTTQRLDAPGNYRLTLGLDPPANRLQAEILVDEPPGGLIGTAAGLRDQPTHLALRLDGPASGARLEARGSIGPEVSLALAGTLRAGADRAYGVVMEGEIAAGPLLPPALRPVASPFTLHLDAALSPAQHLTLAEARFAIPGGALRLTGSADLPAGTVDVAYAVTVPDSARFGALVPTIARWQELRAEGRVQGPIATPRVTADAAVDGFASASPQLAALLGETPRVTLAASVPERVERLELNGAAVSLSVAGRVAAPLDATARLAFPDLAVLGEGFGGAARVEAQVTGTPADPTLALTLGGEEIRLAGHAFVNPALTARIATPFSAPQAEAHMDARFADLPLTLDILGEPDGQRLRLDRAEAVFGPARLSATGMLDPAGRLFEGRLSLEAPQLAPFSVLARMPLAGAVHLAGNFATPGGRQSFDLTAELAGFRAAATTAAGSLTARGTLDDGAFAFDGTAAGAQLRTRADWRGSAEGRRLTVPLLEARYRGESVRLPTPARVLVAPDGGMTVEALTLAPGRGGSIAVAGRWGPDRADLTATLNALPVRLLTGLAGAPTQAEGSLAGRMRLTGATDAPDWQADLRATGLRAVAPWGARLPRAEIRLDATGTAAARADIRVTANAGNALRLNGTVGLPQGFAATAPLAARLDGTADVGVLSAPFLASGADRVTGRLTLGLRAEGSLSAPRFGGDATLSGGSYRNPVLGIGLTDIAGTVAGEQDHLTLRRLTARTAGGGTVEMQGRIGLANGAIAPDITLAARNARALQSDLVTATLDSDLTLTGTLPGAGRLAGTVHLRRVDVRVPETMPASVRTIPDIQERGRGGRRIAPPPAAAAAALPAIDLAVRVEAPRAIFVRGRGIDAELGGTLDVGGTLAAPAAQGGFDLRRGSLTVLDRRLNFQRGRIEFTGNGLVPGLDLLAESRVREVTIRVAVTGQADNPNLAFTSSPEMPQDELLSRLLFDRPARELSPFQIAALAQAAAGAAGYGGPTPGGLLERIRRNLALDRLSIGSNQRESATAQNNNGGGAVLEGGRYVSEGVYVGVRQATNGGPPRIGVQVDVLPRVRIEAETGGNSAAGDRIGLSFEREY